MHYKNFYPGFNPFYDIANRKGKILSCSKINNSDFCQH